MKIAILIPCFNEALTVGKVVRDVRSVFPNEEIFVYDNNSTDKTAELAIAASAIVRSEPQQGKGNVVRRMFKEVHADIYILVDGDDTYPAETAPLLIQTLLESKADMVVGDRLSNGRYSEENTRAFHGFGNNLVRRLINALFRTELKDIMSGYRVFSRDYIRSVPLLSRGFEIETEMTLQALDKGMVIKEIPIAYRDRPPGSFSKLSTYRDGMRVLTTIALLFRDYRPFAFFSAVALFCLIVGTAIGIPPIVEYLRFHYVYKVPSAILAAGIIILGSISLTCGIILDSVKKNVKEQHAVLSGILRELDNKGNR